MPTTRTVVQGQRNEDDELARHLDWADETRKAASIRMAAYRQKVAAYYNRKVRPRVFKEGSLVLRKVFENTVEKGAEKLQANWEGPYVVSKANENGSYHFANFKWNPPTPPLECNQSKAVLPMKAKMEVQCIEVCFINNYEL